MAASKSPTNTSVDTLEKAVRRMAHEYVRHGGKQSRRKRVDRLCLALDWIAREFPACRGLQQIGRTGEPPWPKASASLGAEPTTTSQAGF
jgi:hypothetical protein